MWFFRVQQGRAAIGSVLGGLVNARIIARIGPLPALLTSLVANVLIFGAIGISPDAIVLGVLLALNGFVTTLWSIGAVSLRQGTPAGHLVIESWPEGRGWERRTRT